MHFGGATEFKFLIMYGISGYIDLFDQLGYKMEVELKFI